MFMHKSQNIRLFQSILVTWLTWLEPFRSLWSIGNWQLLSISPSLLPIPPIQPNYDPLLPSLCPTVFSRCFLDFLCSCCLVGSIAMLASWCCLPASSVCAQSVSIFWWQFCSVFSPAFPEVFISSPVWPPYSQDSSHATVDETVLSFNQY